MDIHEIIIDSFYYPRNDIHKVSTYVLISVLAGFSALWGLIYAILPYDSLYTLLGIVLIACSIALYFLLKGYQLSIIKSGLKNSPEVPEFDLKLNFVEGIRLFVVDFVYFLIPTIITLLAVMLTDIPGILVKISSHVGNLLGLIDENDLANSITLFVGKLSAPPMTALVNSLVTAIAISATVAIIFFIIFAFIKAISQARLANSDNILHALNIKEVILDIPKIGWKKFIYTLVIVWAIAILINAILSYISGYIPPVIIILLVADAYLAFYSARVVGSLYSDIA